MTSTTSFRLGDDQSSTESLLSDSDFEDFTGLEGSGRSMDKFYWYGRKVFALFITEMVFEEAESSVTATELDVRVISGWLHAALMLSFAVQIHDKDDRLSVRRKVGISV